MNIRKNSAVYITIIALTAFGLLGWSFALKNSINAIAQSIMTVDEETLEELYETVFHRPVDADGRGFHLGRDLKDVLRDFKYSQEMRYYGALFKAVKSYEEAQRAPGTLTETEKQSYLNLIDSALSNLLAWVSTLPDQDACKATVGAVEAREAIQTAYENISPAAKTAAEKGVFNALKKLGKPQSLNIYQKCLVTPTPTLTLPPPIPPTPTPTSTVLPTPTVLPSPTPTSTSIPQNDVIRVLSPNGGEKWTLGSSQIIQWSSGPAYTPVVLPAGLSSAKNTFVDIDLLSWSTPCIDGPCLSAPSFSVAIARKAPNTGSFSWSVGKNLSGSTIPAGLYIVRVSNEDNQNQYDQSDAPFSIVKQDSSNLPPTISGISGPNVLKVGETGKWEIKASDPEQSRLTYSVIWGDETFVGVSERAVPSYISGTTQVATFTHVYSKAGIYAPTFSVIDIGGLSAKTSISVNVSENVSINNPPVFNVLPQIPLAARVGQPILFSWGATDPDNDNLSWSISWGDGNWIGGACTSLNPQNKQNWIFEASHTWANPGRYEVTAVVTDCRGGKVVYAFNITIQPKPTITVLEPNLGGYWQIGKPHLIKWTSSNMNDSSVNILINRKALGSGGSAYIAKNVPNSSSYAWDGKTIIPQPASMSTLYPGNDYSIIIQNTNDVTINDMSDELFNMTDTGQTPNATLQIKVINDPVTATINYGQSLKLRPIYLHLATGEQIPVIVNWSWTANKIVSVPTGCENGNCYAQDLIVTGNEGGTVTIKAYYIPPGGLDPLLAEIAITVRP